MQLIARARTILAGGEALLSAKIMVLRLATLAGKFAIGLFIARFLGLEALGLYGLVAGAAIIVPSVLRMGLLGVASRDLVGHSAEQAVRTLGHYWVWSVGLFGVLVPLALAGGWAWGHLALVAVALPVLLFEQMALELFMFLGSRQRFLWANLMVFVQSAAWIYLYMVLAWLMPDLRDVTVLLAAWAMGGAVGVLMGFVALRRLPWRSFKWDAKWYRVHVPKGLALWMSDLSITATPMVDRYLVSALLGLQMAGVYVLFWQMANAMATLATNGVMQVYRPKLIDAFDKGKEELYAQLYRRCSLRTLVGALGMAVTIAVVVPFVVPLTRQPLAMDYIPLLWVILAGTMMRIGSDLAGYRLFTRRRDKAFAATGLLGLGLTIGLNLMVVGSGGVYAAAAVIMVVYGTVVAARWSIGRPRAV